MEQWVISISFGELTLKGHNRRSFEDKARRQIRKATKNFEIESIFQEQGKVYLVGNPADYDAIVEKVKRVFGIVYVSKCLQTDKEMGAMSQAAVTVMREKLAAIRATGDMEPKSFRVTVKRGDKSFPMTSTQVAAEIGGDILEQVEGLHVDVHDPEITIWLDIKEHAFAYADRIPGYGGLPMGSGGRGLVLLSGGIDSPVAGFEIAKRGVELGCVHFHSYPFTSERAKDKAIRLAEQMSEFVGPMGVYMVNLLEIYTAIHKNCKARNTTILSRRMMMRIADEIAKRYDYQAMITGESLGQVASQTIQGVGVVNDAAKLPILRPLIAMDKTRIIEIAREIETYEISIEPYDDCCSVFAPDRPNTKPRLYDIEREEENLDIEGLVAQALETMELVKIQ